MVVYAWCDVKLFLNIIGIIQSHISMIEYFLQKLTDFLQYIKLSVS